MSDRTKTLLRRRNSARASLVDLFSLAEHFGLPHADMLDRWNAIKERNKIGASPVWVESYLQGYFESMSANLYRGSLVFGGMIDGKFYSTHSDRPDYYETYGIEPREYADDGKVRDRGHYWAKTLKPFFIG